MADFWFKWNTEEWLNGKGVAILTPQAKGVLADLRSLSHGCTPSGVLATDHRAWTRDEIIRSIRGDANVVRVALDELIRNKFIAQFGQDEGVVPGAFYSPHMLKLAQERESSADRVRKHRSNRVEKGGNANVTALVTVDVTPSVTPNVTAQSLDLRIAAAGAGVREGRTPPDPDAIERRVIALSIRPDWLPEGKPWISRRVAGELARLDGIEAITPDVFFATMDEARDGRKVLHNPAGWVVKRLRELAAEHAAKRVAGGAA